MPSTVSPTILLVEDNPADVELFKARLSAASVAKQYTLDTAATLESGLRHLGMRTYDLILLDLMLPDSGGIATFERIFQRQPNTPIVVFTGMEDESLGRQLIALGAQDFIEKDKVSVNGLNQQLLFAMGRRKASDSARESIQADSIYWLADTIAQEFNQILTDMMANLNLIEAPLKDSPEALVNARKVSEQALSGADVIHLLLSLAKPPSSSPRLPIGTLVKEITPTLRQQFGDAVKIELSDSECDWDSLFDDTQVRTMLLNTIGNIVRHVSPPVRLTLRCGYEIRRTASDSSDVDIQAVGECISIQISAVGASPQKNEGALTNFSMQPGQRLIKSFIEKQGGIVSSHTPTQQGLTIELLLPRSSPQRRVGDQKNYPERLDIRAVNVIVIGADGLADGVVASHISTLGYRTQVEPNLVEALRFVAKGHRTDLIVVSDQSLQKSGAIEQLTAIIGYSFESKLLVICSDSNLDEATRIKLPLPSTTLIPPLSLAEIDEGLRAAHYADLNS